MAEPTKDTGPETPELDKLNSAVGELHTGAIGEFLDWLESKGYWIAEYKQYDEMRDPMLAVTHKSTHQLLADYAGIDMKKVDLERRAVLAWIRGEGSG